MTLKVLLITGRSLRQGVSKEQGKTSERYRDSVALCELHPDDLNELDVKSGSNVRVRTRYGDVVVKAVSSTTITSRGIAFIPYGPYASSVVSPETFSSGMPTFKGVEAEVEPAPQEQVLTMKELVKKYYGK